MHVITTATFMLTFVQYLKLMVKWTDGGLDYTFDCTGNVQVMVSSH